MAGRHCLTVPSSAHLGCNGGYELAIWEKFYSSLKVSELLPTKPLVLGLGVALLKLVVSNADEPVV
jgi:hypothetical protein